MKKLTLLGILLYYTTDIWTQTYQTDSLAARVERFGTGLPQEKVHLHDRQHLLLRGRYRLV